jgi:L-rhamnonate dehydratase
MSGVDQALWDIVGKVSAKRLADVWGRRRSRVRAYASVLFPSGAEEARALTHQILQRGFTAVKFGYGSFGLDREHDRRLLDAIHDVARDHAEIMVDAGRVWSADVAIDRAPELFERYDITFLEEPLNEDDLNGYAQLTGAVHKKIAAGETEATLSAFKRLIEAGLSVLQPDVGRAGSLTICRKVSELAREAGALRVAHCFGTGINLAASLHWMASVNDAPFIEFPLTESPLRTSLVPNPPRQRDGWVSLPDRPGLRIDIDERILRDYAYPLERVVEACPLIAVEAGSLPATPGRYSVFLWIAVEPYSGALTDTAYQPTLRPSCAAGAPAPTPYNGSLSRLLPCVDAAPLTVLNSTKI